MTFSIVARDPTNGDLGVAVQSRFLAVGASVPHAVAGVGAVATQALANVGYGPRGLALMQAGASAELALCALVEPDELRERRQVAVLDREGRVAVHTGSGCTPWAGHRTGDGFSCQGNILVSEATIDAMVDVMAERDEATLADRLVTALAAGQVAGGDARGQQSAAVLVVRVRGGYGGESDRLVDLRVDDHVDPIGELRRLLDLHRLYFERPAEGELLPIDASLAREIAELLPPIGGDPGEAADLDALWDRLERWAGRENLEMRMVRRGAVDRTVLRILRQQARS